MIAPGVPARPAVHGRVFLPRYFPRWSRDPWYRGGPVLFRTRRLTFRAYPLEYVVNIGTLPAIVIPTLHSVRHR